MIDTEAVTRFVSAELEGRRHPGSSVSIVKDGDVAWSRGFGYSDLRSGVEATPETIYGCASVTKPLVTIGFLQLMERGKFSLDDAVNEHIDIKITDIKGDEPRIRDLLTHYTGMPTRVPPLHLLGETPDDVGDYLRSALRMVEPRGAVWAYCNPSFTIIGQLIKKYTGVEYDAYLKEHVLRPLDMTSSDFELSPLVLANLAQGYKRAGGPENPVMLMPHYYLGMKPADPAGSLYSSVLDLSKFLVMNMNGGVYKGRRVLGEETIDEMQRLNAKTGKSRSGMGLTWFRTIHDGRVMLYHTGGLPDFTNHVCFYPEEKLGVCWLSNLQDGTSWRPPAPTVLRIALGNEVAPAYLQSQPENWKKLVGLYGDEKNQLNIRFVNGYLTLGDRLILERIDDTHFMVHGAYHDGEELTFEYAEDGSVTQLDLGQSYYRRYAPKTRVVDFGAELLGNWSGEYYDHFGFHIVNLRVIGRTTATICGPNGEYVPLVDFRAELGRVTGTCNFRIPREYARWGTRDCVEVMLELSAEGGKLVGSLRVSGEADELVLTKAL